MANNKMTDYWFIVEGKMTFLKMNEDISEDIAEDYIKILCGREPDAWGEFHEIVDKRDEPIVDYCNDCDGKCKSMDTEVCENCSKICFVGCGNNPSDESIFNGLCDDCRDESDEELLDPQEWFDDQEYGEGIYWNKILDDAEDYYKIDLNETVDMNHELYKIWKTFQKKMDDERE